MSNRLAAAFARAEHEQRAALIVYLCAGDPDLDTTVALMRAAIDAGADILEVGMPFSDPTAESIASMNGVWPGGDAGGPVAGAGRT